LWVLDRNTFRRILMEESMRRRKLYESVLVKVPLFKGLLPYERTKIADALEGVSFKDKDVIIQQGSTDTDKFYIIEKGQAVCTKRGQDENEVEALRLNAGDYFGELALLRNEPRQATVTAVGPLKCLTIGREHFNQVMGPCEDILRRNMEYYKSYEELISTITHPEVQKTNTNFEISLKDLPESRGELILYIIKNEADYEKCLTQTEGYFNAMSAHLKLTEEQLTAIFSNVKDILINQKQFNERLSDFEKRIYENKQPNNNNGDLIIVVDNQDFPNVGELYSSFAPSLAVYEKFVSDYPKSVATRKERSNDSEYSNFLMECQKVAGESLDVYLEEIYTRVPRLVALLQHLLDITEPLHPDKNSLAVALRKIETHHETLKKIAVK